MNRNFWVWVVFVSLFCVSGVITGMAIYEQTKQNVLAGVIAGAGVTCTLLMLKMEDKK